MDAGEMTRMAKDWKTVPDQKKCTTEENVLPEPVVIAPGEEESVSISAELCKEIKHLEHVQLHVSINRCFQLALMFLCCLCSLASPIRSTSRRRPSAGS